MNCTLNKINLPWIDIFPTFYLMAEELKPQIICKVVRASDPI